MLRVGDVFRRARVAAIYLVHGTFAGCDATGLLAELARLWPAAAAALGRLGKSLFDLVASEHGNYTDEYAALFERLLAAAGRPAIPVRLFHWSSENHHLGRADGAVRLIDELAAAELLPGSRILLWGHSHAGNVFALLTNLLAGDAPTVERFFAAAACYYRWPLLGLVDIPVWARVAALLRGGKNPLARHLLDIVTFGTPVRYGWDRAGYDQLLHFIHHRPQPGASADRAVLPRGWNDIAAAAGGDYVQQLGIAGTNVMPAASNWRAWLADRRLGALLEADLDRANLLQRLALGVRVPDAGVTLLVDYGPAADGIARHCAGHAVYTRTQWLLFHAEQVARRLYRGAWRAAPE